MIYFNIIYYFMLLVLVWILIHNQSLYSVLFSFSVLLRYSGPENNETNYNLISVCLDKIKIFTWINIIFDSRPTNLNHKLNKNVVYLQRYLYIILL